AIHVVGSGVLVLNEIKVKQASRVSLSAKQVSVASPCLCICPNISENSLSQNPSTYQTTTGLPARLDKMTKDLEGLRLLNDPLKDQVELVHEEVENEVPKAIL
ncbi:hypothetical protein Tco_1550537, partial [Tanacetum coccineum]